MFKTLQRPAAIHFRIPVLVVFIIIIIMSSFSWGSSLQETNLEKSTKAAIIDWMCLKLNEIYVFPDVAKKMDEYLRNKLKDGDYDSISDPGTFTRILRGDLIKISHDRHFNVVYAPEPSIRMERPDPEEEKKREEQRIRELEYDNYHFKKAERLDGKYALGSAIGVADGLSKAGVKERPVALFGDSTFFHTALPAICNAAHNRSDILMVLLDNRSTASTGFQPHPGVVKDAHGRDAPGLSIEGIARACGVDLIYTVNYDSSDKRLKDAFRNALASQALALVIVRTRTE